MGLGSGCGRGFGFGLGVGLRLLARHVAQPEQGEPLAELLLGDRARAIAVPLLEDGDDARVVRRERLVGVGARVRIRVRVGVKGWG